MPFKPNIRNRYKYAASPEGEYILCFGCSEIDYDTSFSAFSAMEQLPELPAAIAAPDFAQLARHASRFTRRLEDLPRNVRVLSGDGSVELPIEMIEKAKIVVLPMLASKIAPSGIGTYLKAMLMGKISEVPAISDIPTHEVVIVKSEEVPSLRDAIRKVREEEKFRLYAGGTGGGCIRNPAEENRNCGGECPTAPSKRCG